jgi:hypothetical protein
VVSFNRQVAPVIVRNPKVEGITFHQSDQAMVKVDVVSEDE